MGLQNDEDDPQNALLDDQIYDADQRVELAHQQLRQKQMQIVKGGAGSWRSTPMNTATAPTVTQAGANRAAAAINPLGE